MRSVERQVGIAVFAAVMIGGAALVFFVASVRNPAASSAPHGDAVVDAALSAVQRGAPPQVVLDTLAASNSIRSGIVYGNGGQRVATLGTASPDAELLCRSLPAGGSICIEGATARERSALSLAVASRIAIPLVAVALLAALTAAFVVRRRLTLAGAAAEHAISDPKYAARIETGAGGLERLTATINRLLDDVQNREVTLRRRTAELEAANADLHAFASTISHDLRAPLGTVSGFAQALDQDFGATLVEGAKECVHWILDGAARMQVLIEGLLEMARLSRANVERRQVDISSIARRIGESLQQTNPDRKVDFAIQEGIVTTGDERLLHAVLENLIGNAWKFTSRQPEARIEVGVRDDNGCAAYYVRDNGAGFDPSHAAKMFRPFQRLHSEREFSGTGIGLATVHKIVQRHGGRAWAEGDVGKGATVYFTTGMSEESAPRPAA